MNPLHHRPLLLLLLAALALFSCTGRELDESPAAGRVSFDADILPAADSRTVIGTKDGSVYPVYWTAADKLSINGTASSEAEFEGETAKTARFTAEIAPASEYYIVSPYTAGNAAGEVTFAASALPMYAYATDLSSESVGLKALYGVLKISVTGTARLTGITLKTQEGDQISGKFTVDRDGNLTGTDPTATESTLSFPDSLQLTQTPADFYISVPKGTYNIFDLCLNDCEGGSMTRKIGGGDSCEVKAGIVREFPVFEYAANSHLWAIASESDLLKFAAAVEAGNPGGYEGAVLCNDIPLSGHWTPIKSFGGIFEGKGHTISNLDTCLFGALDGARVSNLKLDADSIVFRTGTDFGALACTATGGCIVDSVSLSGSVNLDRSDAPGTDACFAGLVGNLKAGTISNCTSTAVVQLIRSADYTLGTDKTSVYMGSLAGRLGADDGMQGAAITGCRVSGTGQVKSSDNTAAALSAQTIYEGGIAGIVCPGSSIGGCAVEGGAIGFRQSAFCLHMGGIAGRTVGNLKDCSLSVTMSVSKSGATISYPYIGGMAGSAGTIASGDPDFLTELENCSVTGSIYYGGSGLKTFVHAYFGGMVGTCTNSSIRFTGCHSAGGYIRILSLASGATQFCVGGILGQAWSGSTTVTFSGCTNETPLRVTPASAPVGEKSGYRMSVGGIAGALGTSVNVVSSGSNTNSGHIEIKNMDPTTGPYSYIGGCIGASRKGSATLTGFRNTGDITVDTDGTATNGAKVCTGGIAGHTAYPVTLDGCDARCSITNPAGKSGILMGWENTKKNATNCKVGGSINGSALVDDTASGWHYLNKLFSNGPVASGYSSEGTAFWAADPE